MLSLIKPLIVNITILFSLTFNANLFLPFQKNVKLTLKYKSIYGFLGAFGALLCMAYPIETLGETNFDLRMIAIMVVTLYAGWIPGSIIVTIVSIARFIIGGSFLHIGIIVSIGAFVISLLFRKQYLNATNRFVSASYISIIYFLFYIIVIYINIDFLDAKFYYIYFLAFYGTYMATIFIIETLMKSNKQFDEMVYMDKLTTTGQMAASIAHEIRNPITTVRGFIQLIQQDTVDQKLKRFAPLILEELDRTNNIITNYLKLAKPESFELTKVELNAILSDSIELLRPLGTFSNVSIEFTPCKESCFVNGNIQHIKQSLLNIIKNAIESIEEYGVIVIRTDIDRNEGRAIITIEDNGKGMTKEELKHIGLPFYTTKTKGTGLGSMITNRLIRQIGGTIEYSSELGKGTAVTVTFQLV
ncbi:ATP-binding protein [Metabacillus litoralis]|uniref:ATP-binding protein n=1 Tax=Metabacillus litoralis TaxID=152268 RepID=UPI00203CF28E|nr:ATP-binding protein [Metabacillus litoralis]MCM3408815.1 ATP-binding protein [Metabacillus litoralis]